MDRANYADTATITNLTTNGKYFILHSNNQSFALTKVKVNNESLEGEVETLPKEHTKYLHPRIEHPNRFKQKNKDIVLDEVHLYAKGNATGYNRM